MCWHAVFQLQHVLQENMFLLLGSTRASNHLCVLAVLADVTKVAAQSPGSSSVHTKCCQPFVLDLHLYTLRESVAHQSCWLPHRQAAIACTSRMLRARLLVQEGVGTLHAVPLL